MHNTVLKTLFTATRRASRAESDGSWIGSDPTFHWLVRHVGTFFAHVAQTRVVYVEKQGPGRAVLSTDMLFRLTLLASVVAVALATEPIKVDRKVLFHSHNDYVHHRPVYDAFDHGVLSFESDFWFDEHKKALYVAHTPLGIDHSKTFNTQTVDRVLNIVQGKYSDKYPASNVKKFFAEPKNQTTAHPDWYKYFSEGFGGVRPIMILAEPKTSADPDMWKTVVDALGELRSQGLLTRYEYGKVHFGPVIVVGTGNTPYSQVVATPVRDYFMDCHADGLKDEHGQFQYNATACPISSAGYPSVPHSNLGLTPPPKAAIPYFAKYTCDAHIINSTVRFYGVPKTAGRIDDFNMLLQQGADWLNIDHFDDVKRYS